MPSENFSLVVPAEYDGARLDKVLSSLLAGRSRSFLARLIEDGRVSVDGEVVTRPARTVAEGNVVDLSIPEPKPLDVAGQEIPLHIIHGDADIVVIEKPAGLVVHPAAGHVDATLVNALLFHVEDLSGIGGELRPGIVHRLDKETSGLMVVAKNDSAHRALSESWGSERVRKEYLALVYGTPKEETGTIDRPIGRDPRDRKKMTVVEGGRRAVTDYAVQERLRYVSLLRCRLRTGRTHQIRVHLKSTGHPIVGDALYSGPQWRGIPDKRVQKLLASFPRQALHATLLRFPHPSTGEMLTFELPPPPDMAQLIEELRKI